MVFLKKILALGSVLSVVQLLLGLDMFFRGSWAFVWPHLGLGLVLLATLAAALVKSKPYRRVRMHVAVTLVLLVVQGLIGLDMFMRGAALLFKHIHLVLGFLTAGSYIGTYMIARRVVS